MQEDLFLKLKVKLVQVYKLGRVEGGLIATDIGKTDWSNQEENNSGFYAEWGDGRGHNFLGAGIGIEKTSISIGGDVDYITPHMTPPGGDITQYYADNGCFCQCKSNYRA